VKCGRCIRPSMSAFPTQYGILNISQPSMLPRSLNGDNFTFFYVDGVHTSQETLLWASMACYRDSLTLYMLMVFTPHRKLIYGPPQPLTGITSHFYIVYGVRTSQETHLSVSAACYGDSFTILYVDYVRTSQENHLWAYPACYRDRFTFMYIYDVRTSRETLLWTCTARYGDNSTILIL
jgi:hypothetical protein